MSLQQHGAQLDTTPPPPPNLRETLSFERQARGPGKKKTLANPGSLHPWNLIKLPQCTPDDSPVSLQQHDT